MTTSSPVDEEMRLLKELDYPPMGLEGASAEDVKDDSEVSIEESDSEDLEGDESVENGSHEEQK